MKNQDEEAIFLKQERKIDIEEDENQLIEIDKIHNKYGYRWEVWKIIIAAILILSIDGCFTQIAGAFQEPMKSVLNLTDYGISGIAFSFFMSKSFGSFLCPYINNWFTRPWSLILSMIIILLSQILIAFLPNLTVTIITRIISGFCAGVLEPVINNLLCEYLPIYYRGFFLISVWFGFNIGKMFPSVMMYWLMPNYEISQMSNTLLSICSLPLISIIYCAFFLRDSPRNYILIGKNEEKAFYILEKINFDQKISDERRSRIKEEVQHGVNEQFNGSISDLFKHGLLLTTISIFLISFISNMQTDGLGITTSMILSTVDPNSPPKSVIVDTIIVNAAGIPSYIVAGLLCEVNTIGRKWTILIGFIFLITIGLIPSIISLQPLPTLLLVYSFCSSYLSITAPIYGSEIYPTRIRDIGVGLAMFATNAGSAMAQYVYVILHIYNIKAPFILSLVTAFIACASTAYLGYETNNKPLDIFIKG
jgi:MFS family permease